MSKTFSAAFPQFGAFRNLVLPEVDRKKPSLSAQNFSLDMRPLRHYSRSVTCPNCKSEFDKKCHWHKFCSKRCGNSYRVKKHRTKIKKALKFWEEEKSKLRERTA